MMEHLYGGDLCPNCIDSALNLRLNLANIAINLTAYIA